MPRDKDPNKPKGRMTAYAFFVQAQRDHLKKTEPDKNVEFKLFSKACSCDWKQIPPKEKMKFEALAQADKVRYDREMAGYTPRDDGLGGKKHKSKKTKDPNAPKRGMSGFLFYCSERRPELKKQNAEWGMSDLSRALGDEWRAFDDVQKAPYLSRATADKERYVTQMTSYKKGEMWTGETHCHMHHGQQQQQQPQQPQQAHGHGHGHGGHGHHAHGGHGHAGHR